MSLLKSTSRATINLTVTFVTIYLILITLAIALHTSLHILHRVGLLGKILCTFPIDILDLNFMARTGRWAVCSFPAAQNAVIDKVLSSDTVRQKLGESVHTATIFVFGFLIGYRIVMWAMRSVGLLKPSKWL